MPDRPMKEHQILFKTPMVRALLDRNKRQTRRYHSGSGDFPGELAPTGLRWQAGDRLWVRETWQQLPDGRFVYRADGEDERVEKWRPSIFMPR